MLTRSRPRLPALLWLIQIKAICSPASYLHQCLKGESMSNAQFGRHRQRTAGMRSPLACWLAGRIGADKGSPYRLRSRLHPSLRISADFHAQRLEAIRRVLVARVIAPRLVAQFNQHLTQMADAMAAR
ncbi:hypothetical protein [Mesorhizobium sp. J8]|uniref:hypothetical protein n=1 Tax=Mesorhizobium sp. J8 TaxID=2777475 RepID=UPI0019157E85|nr:hypothetical protein [Mesorhizobium sp. J8]